MEGNTHLSLSNSKRVLSGAVQLTGSKSESNRALILAALSGGRVTVENLSDADDTAIMQQALRAATQPGNGVTTVDIGPAGTAMRFLTAYLPLVDGGEFLLTGTPRMQQRPIGILAEALKTLGADIAYAGAEGFPPLRIRGGFRQSVSRISMKGSVSSQYLSALLLIAASLPQGLELHIEDELTSRPYVEMTLRMLEETGIAHRWAGQVISIQPQQPRNSVIYVEPDWSAASYWYSMLALVPEGRLFLRGLKKDSLQGDRAIADIMEQFGIASVFEPDGVTLSKTGQSSEQQSFDFKSCPDLAQTVIVCCAALGRDATFTGLETLKIKETDRIRALQQELEKFGVSLTEAAHQEYRLDTSRKYIPETLHIDTYEDHRMAMAFAPLALVFPEVVIEDPAVVGKSYPAFWRDLQQHGFTKNTQQYNGR